MITPEMLLNIMNKSLTPFTSYWEVSDNNMARVEISDGRIDLIEAAELLNTELVRQAQATEPAGMLDINVTAWDGT